MFIPRNMHVKPSGVHSKRSRLDELCRADSVNSTPNSSPVPLCYIPDHAEYNRMAQASHHILSQAVRWTRNFIVSNKMATGSLLLILDLLGSNLSTFHSSHDPITSLNTLKHWMTQNMGAGGGCNWLQKYHLSITILNRPYSGHELGLLQAV